MKDQIVLVAESGADISPELQKQYNISIVPMHVTFGEQTKPDGSFPPEEICSYYERTGAIPKTSAATPEDFETVFDAIHDCCPHAHILYLAYSAVTTCSFQCGQMAAEGRDYITCLDTKQVSMGQCLVVVQTARAIQQHPEWTLEQAIDAAKDMISRARMWFIPSNLDYLRAGGRVSNAVALCGNLLQIHPCIELDNGYLRATKKYRGKMERVVRWFIQDFAGAFSLDQDEIWLGYTSGLSAEIRQAAEETAMQCGFAQVQWVQAGGVITTHGGPSAFGMAGVTRK